MQGLDRRRIEIETLVKPARKFAEVVVILLQYSLAPAKIGAHPVLGLTPREISLSYLTTYYHHPGASARSAEEAQGR
jgi:hypothetical protein